MNMSIILIIFGIILIIIIGKVIINNTLEAVDKCMIEKCNCSSVNYTVCISRCNESCMAIGDIP